MIEALQIINEVNDLLGWPQLTTIENPTITDEQRKIVSLVNRVARTVQGIDDWPMLRKSAEVVLVAYETSDTTSGSEQYVVATLNSKTLTVNNMTFSDTYKERAILISGDKYVYRIKKILSATQVELNRAWVSASITASDEKTFTIAADMYALPDDFDRPTDDWENFWAPNEIKPLDPNAFMEKRRLDSGINVGEPKWYTIYGSNPGKTVELIHFHPYPQNKRLLTFDYQANHPAIDSDNDKLYYPVRYMQFFIDAVLELAQRHYEDDEKANATLADMIRDYNWQTQRLTETQPEMRPNTHMRQSFQQAYGHGGRYINWGSHFDKVENVNLP